jgi:hypothetical protein
MTNRSNVPLKHTAFKTAMCATTLAALLALATAVQAQTDSFDSSGGSLDPAAGWGLLTSPNFPTTYTFPADAFGGHAFRMQGGVPVGRDPLVKTDGQATARAAAVCTNTSYGDFYVAADLVSWDTNLYRSTNYSFVGLAARVNTDLGAISSGVGWNGLALFYWNNVDTQNTNSTDPVSPSNSDGPSTGTIGIGWVINGCVYFNAPMLASPGGVGVSAIAEWTLNPGHTYRLTFQGVGDYLTAKVFDTQDLTRPLGTIGGDTSLSTFVFLTQIWFQPPPTSGWSGLCALRYSDNYDTNGVTDATFDNFYAAAAPPATAVTPPGIPNGEAGVAQVISRTPASWANFYSPAGGITFTGSTLSTTATINTSATRLVLNGIDLSSSLTITPTSPATNVSVSFGLPGSSYSLASNIVYDASIILQDSLGRKTTNVFTFDTFTEAYLARYGNIECEDYDFINPENGSPGTSWDFPVTASGFSTNDNTWYTPAGSVAGPLGYDYPINCLANSSAPQQGYVGLSGMNAFTNGGIGDYYECVRTKPMAGQPLDLPALATGGGLSLNSLLPACEYRTGVNAAGGVWPDTGNRASNGDTAGTQPGGAFGLSVINLTANNGILQANYLRDTKRQKYAALNAAGLAQAGGRPGSDYSVTGSSSASWWDIEEYNVVATDGSDWFNYTHDWGTATNYNVYLRNACAKSQHLYLYNGATTNRASQVGTFYCTNALQWNWRYTPLLDGSGNLAVVNLGGQTTLRLEVNPEEPKWTSIARGLALNYLAFVPTGRAQLVTNVVYSTTNRITAVVKGAGSTFTVSALGTPGAQYYLVTSGNIKTAMGSWTPVAGSTNTAATPSGTWSATVSAAAPAYYRAVAVNPHP